jgi:hypothetical protein
MQSMHIEKGPVTRGKDGKTRIHFEVVVEESYDPGTLHAQESGLREQLNGVITQAMTECLQRFDTAGEPIFVGGVEFTSKGRFPAVYQCSGGECLLERQIYQSSKGGRTFCPLEDRARIVENATPCFAEMLASKYSRQSGRSVQSDLERCHQRHVSLDYIQKVAERMGKVAVAQERARPYELRANMDAVAAVVVMADATCTALVGEDYKQVACGAFCLLDGDGQRLETIYLAQVPEEGKKTFWEAMERERLRILAAAGPEVPWFGVCDGAPDIQQWLEERCDVVTLDFYHLSTYIHGIKEAFGTTPQQHEAWVARTLHAMKHNEGAAAKLLGRIRRRAGDQRPEQSEELTRKLGTCIGYLERNLERMEYALVRGENMPIGSGIIEAACKCVVKERVCGSGMRWKRPALQGVLTLRCLDRSSDRWDQFWKRCATFGY